MYINDSGVHRERAFFQHLDRSVKNHRHDRNTGSDRENEGPFLEWAKAIIVAAGTLGKDDNRIAAANLLGRDIIGSESGLPVVALNLDHPRGANPRAEHGNLEQLRLRDEFVARQRAGESRNVEPADVIGGEDPRLTGAGVLPTVNAYPHPRRQEYHPRPPARDLVVDTTRFVLHAHQGGRDNYPAKDRGGDRGGDKQQKRSEG